MQRQPGPKSLTGPGEEITGGGSILVGVVAGRVRHVLCCRCYIRRIAVHLAYAKARRKLPAIPCLILCPATLLLALRGDVPGLRQRLLNGRLVRHGVRPAGIRCDAKPLHVALPFGFGVGKGAGYVSCRPRRDAAKVSLHAFLRVGHHLLFKVAVSRLVLVVPLHGEVELSTLQGKRLFLELLGGLAAYNSSNKVCSPKSHCGVGCHCHGFTSMPGCCSGAESARSKSS